MVVITKREYELSDHAFCSELSYLVLHSRLKWLLVSSRSEIARMKIIYIFISSQRCSPKCCSQDPGIGVNPKSSRKAEQSLHVVGFLLLVFPVIK